MKKVIIMGFILLALLTFSACQKVVEEVSQVEPDFEVQGQVASFAMMLDRKYALKSQDTYDVFYMSTYEATDGKQIRIIEEREPGYVVDEVYLEEELTAVAEIATERTEVLAVEGFGNLYGALLEDHTLGDHMFYYKFNVGSDVVTILFHNKKKFTELDEASVKRMVSTLKSQ